jgi:hypothetical protein
MNALQLSNTPAVTTTASRIKFLESENEILRNKLMESFLENAQKTRSLEERIEMLEEKNKQQEPRGKNIILKQITFEII